MFHSTSVGRRVAAIAVVAAALAVPSFAQVRAFVDAAADPGPAERILVIEGSIADAGKRFQLVPTVDGVPSRTLASGFERTSGLLNRSGRAMVVVTGARRLAAGGTPAVRVLVDGAPESTAGNVPVVLGLAAGTVTGQRRGPVLTEASGAALPDVLSVTAPVDGAVVGSPTIDVRGRLAGDLNDAGTEVRVNGVLADVFPSGGVGRFLLPNLELSPGLNAVSVTATPPGGTPQTVEHLVQLAPLTSNNVVVSRGVAYAARGTQGVGVMDLATRTFTTVAPPPGSDRIDDVAVADGFLFVLDGASGGRLAVFDVSDPMTPVLASTPLAVQVGPFAGVSAGGGRVVVSGGTGLLSVRSYDASGQLSAAQSTIDLGIGQPDVLVSPDGLRAHVSTDFSGTVDGARFGITTLALNAPPAAPAILDRIGVPGAGFTGGFQSPANFPIESALIGDELFVAHGGGLSRIDAAGTLVGTRSLGFAAVSADAVGTELFVVGTGRRLARLDAAASGAPVLVETQTLPTGTLTGVAATEAYVAVASGAAGLRVIRR
ncbi:MAG: hypothetical protein AAFZ87_05845 [Planctomycetota bacterium]